MYAVTVGIKYYFARKSEPLLQCGDTTTLVKSEVLAVIRHAEDVNAKIVLVANLSSFDEIANISEQLGQTGIHDHVKETLVTLLDTSRESSGNVEPSDIKLKPGQAIIFKIM